MTTIQKFAPVSDVLRSAVTGDVDLDTEYPTIFQKVYRHYEEKGVDFYGNPDEDYAILIDKLEFDLF
jgi:hypothetical protein